MTERLRVRTTVEDDCVAIEALQARNGMTASVAARSEAQSRAGYRHLYSENPALPADRPWARPGWVLESGEQIVGYFGNFPLAYYAGDRSYVAAVASSFVVDAPFRSSSFVLAAEFCRQKDVDFLLSTTANYRAGRVFTALKCERLPQVDYDHAWFWVTSAFGFSAAVLRKRGWPVWLAAPAAAVVGPVLSATTSFRGGPPGGRQALEIRAVAVGDVGADFDHLWARKRREQKYLLLCRDAASLRWHFARHSALGKEVRIWGCWRENELAGYLIATSEHQTAIGLKRSRIVDLIAASDDPAVIVALVSHERASAAEHGTHVVELMGFPPAVRAALSGSGPRSRTLPVWPLFFKGVSQAFADAQRLSAWHISAIDGDSSL